MTRLESIRAEHKRLCDESQRLCDRHDEIMRRHSDLPWWAFWRSWKLLGEGYELLGQLRAIGRRREASYRQYLCALEREGKVRVG